MSRASSDGDLEQAWEDLAVRAAAPPCVYPGWVKAWCRSFGGGSPQLLSQVERGSLIAALPLVALGHSYRSPTNWHTPEYGSLSMHDQAAEQLFNELLASPVAQIDLSHIGLADTGRFERAAVASSRRHIAWTQQESPYVDTSGDWDVYRSGRDARWLRQLERRRTGLQGDAGVALDLYDGRRDLGALLDEGFRLEAAGWKGEAGTAVLSAPSTRQFYWEAARWAADRGFLRLAFLRVGGRAVAFDYCLEDGKRHYFMKTGFDPALRAQAPGLILRHDMIRRAFELGLESYEMLGGPEAYKLAWTETTRIRYRAIAFDRSVRGRTAWLARRYGRPVAKDVVRRLKGAQDRRRARPVSAQPPHHSQ